MVDVHDEQLLVLLLVVQTQLEQLGRSLGHTTVDELQNGGVDVLAVLGDLRDAWAGDQPALGSGVTSADGLVVGVEQEPEALVVGRVLGSEHERLEEPRRVGAVPLGGTGVGHRLHGLVLGAEWGGESLGERPHSTELAVHAIHPARAGRRSGDGGTEMHAAGVRRHDRRHGRRHLRGSPAGAGVRLARTRSPRLGRVRRRGHGARRPIGARCGVRHRHVRLPAGAPGCRRDRCRPGCCEPRRRPRQAGRRGSAVAAR